MTIDESIARAREVAEENRKVVDVKGKIYASNCLKCAEEHEQLAEWLEELKAYKESLALKKEFYEGVKRSRADAIDEFLERFIELLLLGNVDVEDLRKLAEQLQEQTNE